MTNVTKTTKRTEGRTSRHLLVRLALLAAALVLPSAAFAQIAQTPPELQHVGVTEQLDKPLPLDTPFRDQSGKAVKLGDFFDGTHPVVLTFAYHSCPVLCSMVLNNEADGLKGVSALLGHDFQAVTISIDPHETLEKTAAKRHSILTEYGRLPAVAGADPFPGAWPFLVGDAQSIAAVEKAAGFEAEYDPELKQWAHPSVVMIVTPDGKMARYLYGLEFAPNDLRLALLEASKGHSISTTEQIILYCYHYDPKGGKYVLVAQRVMQIGGGAVGLILISILATLWLRELRRHQSETKNIPGSGEPPATRDRAQSAV
jgi:protein SCO1/2